MSAVPLRAAATGDGWLDRLGLHYAFIPLVVMPLALVLAPSGHLAWLAAGYPVAAVLLDRVLPRSRPGVAPARLAVGDLWLYLFIVWLALLTLALAYLLRSRGDITLGGLRLRAVAPGAAQCLGFALVLGLVYGVNTNVAHELIHRSASPAKRFLGFLLFSIGGDGQLAVSHIHGHHQHVAMACDPASARAGESLYRFLARSFIGQYRESWTHECRRLGRARLSPRNRVLAGAAITVAVAAGLGAIGGARMVAIYLAACAMGKALFELANYIQHYGLVRLPGTKCAARHSWDSDAAFTRSFMFNLNRHAQHHARAGLRHWELAVMTDSPRLPHGYLAMFALALVPPLWFRVMEPERRLWLAHYASAAERQAALAGQARS